MSFLDLNHKLEERKNDDNYIIRKQNRTFVSQRSKEHMERQRIFARMLRIIDFRNEMNFPKEELGYQASKQGSGGMVVGNAGSREDTT